MPLASDAWAAHLGDSVRTVEANQLRHAHLPLRRRKLEPLSDHPGNLPSAHDTPRQSRPAPEPQPLTHCRAEQSEPVPRPFEDAISLRLPKHVYNRGEDQCSCAVCLQPFDEGGSLRRLPCRHTCHVSCIDRWLTRSPSCPKCHFDLSNLMPKHVTAAPTTWREICPLDEAAEA